MKMAVNRSRNKITGFLPNRENDIPEKLHYDTFQELFLRFDSGIDDPKRFLIFFSEFKKNFKMQARIILIDGTFKVAPHNFTQLVTIHATLFGKPFPMIYILLSDKSEESYILALTKIKSLIDFNPEVVLNDLEKGLINAHQKVFPYSKTYLCLFHFGQAIWRRIQSLGLTRRYLENVEINKTIKCVLSISFVPAEKVKIIYNKFRDSLNLELKKELKEFFDYYEKMFIGKLDKNTGLEIPAIYNINYWNCYERIYKNIPRTTNSLEGWHRSFNAANEIFHPNIARFITKIIDKEDINRFMLIRAKEGMLELQKKNLLKEAKIRVYVENFYLFDDFVFLNAISDIYKWKLNE